MRYLPFRFWVWYWASLYAVRPSMYLEHAKRYWATANPSILRNTLLKLGEHQWPLVLWVWSKQYEADEGLTSFPNTCRLEDALLRDVASRAEDPGPIANAIQTYREEAEARIEWMASETGQSWLKERVDSVRHRNPRLREFVDSEDNVNDAVLLFAEVGTRPWVKWEFPKKKMTADEIEASDVFVERTLGLLLPRLHGANRKVSRVSDSIEETETRGPGIRDETAEEAFESYETKDDTRKKLREVMDALPPKQREAAEVNLRAMQAGISLEEQSRHEERDPKKVRENFKAAQRRFRP